MAELDPRRLGDPAAAAARGLLIQGGSANTLASYATALRYWVAWFGLRATRSMRHRSCLLRRPPSCSSSSTTPSCRSTQSQASWRQRRAGLPTLIWRSSRKYRTWVAQGRCTPSPGRFEDEPSWRGQAGGPQADRRSGRGGAAGMARAIEGLRDHRRAESQAGLARGKNWGRVVGGDDLENRHVTSRHVTLRRGGAGRRLRGALAPVGLHDGSRAPKHSVQ